MGFLSKAWKGVKKVVKKVARAAKKVAKKVTLALPGGKELWKLGGKIGTGIMKGLNKLGPIGTIALSFVLPGIGAMLGAMWSGFGTAVNVLSQIGSTITGALGKAGTFIFDGASKLVSQSLGTVGEAITQGLTKITTGAKGLLGDTGGKILDSLKTNFPDATKKVTEMATKATDFVAEKGGDLFDNIKEKFNEKIMDTGTPFSEARAADITADVTSDFALNSPGAPAQALKDKITEGIADTSFVDKARLLAEESGLTKAVKVGKNIQTAVTGANAAAGGPQQPSQQEQMGAPVVITAPPAPVPSTVPLAGQLEDPAKGAQNDFFAQLVAQAQQARGGFA
jgi:hypothetical protein